MCLTYKAYRTIPVFYPPATKRYILYMLNRRMQHALLIAMSYVSGLPWHTLDVANYAIYDHVPTESTEFVIENHTCDGCTFRVL